MLNIIKAAFPNSKFEALPQIVIKNASDYIVAGSCIPVSTKSLVAVVEKVSPVPAVITPKQKALVPITNPSMSKKKEVYDFIDEDVVPGKRPVPEAGAVQKRAEKPTPEAGKPVKILQRPAPEAGTVQKRTENPSPEAVPEKTKKSGSVNEIERSCVVVRPVREEAEPTNSLQLLLALNDPDLMLMDAGQWGSYIHKCVTDEYVYIGQTKSMPFYRKRKQLMQDLEALERSKGAKLIEFGNILNYLAWRYDVQLLVHKYDTDKNAKSVSAYPEMHLWRRATPIYCVGVGFVSPLKFSQLREYLEISEETGVYVEWPSVDGKKTELLAELDGQGAHLKKDELAHLVGKKRVYDLFEH